MDHVEFNHKEHLFGCMAYVIHLDRINGITALGGKEYLNNEEEEATATCVMSVTQSDNFDF